MAVKQRRTFKREPRLYKAELGSEPCGQGWDDGDGGGKRFGWKWAWRRLCCSAELSKIVAVSPSARTVEISHMHAAVHDVVDPEP